MDFWSPERFFSVFRLAKCTYPLFGRTHIYSNCFTLITNKHFFHSYSCNHELRFSLPCVDSVPVGLPRRLISGRRATLTAGAWSFVRLQQKCYAQQSVESKRLILFASYFHSLLPRNREGCVHIVPHRIPSEPILSNIPAVGSFPQKRL